MPENDTRSGRETFLEKPARRREARRPLPGPRPLRTRQTTPSTWASSSRPASPTGGELAQQLGVEGLEAGDFPRRPGTSSPRPPYGTKPRSSLDDEVYAAASIRTITKPLLHDGLRTPHWGRASRTALSAAEGSAAHVLLRHRCGRSPSPPRLVPPRPSPNSKAAPEEDFAPEGPRLASRTGGLAPFPPPKSSKSKMSRLLSWCSGLLRFPGWRRLFPCWTSQRRGDLGRGFWPWAAPISSRVSSPVMRPFGYGTVGGEQVVPVLALVRPVRLVVCGGGTRPGCRRSPHTP